jgi:hypothetical protein
MAQDDSSRIKKGGPNGRPKINELPTVNIMTDPGIWACLDEGCNSNCHGDEWADNAILKLKNFNVRPGFLWLHRRVTNYNGIGPSPVKTTGKRRLPTAFMLRNSQKILPGFLESNEQKGGHPLLLSGESQAMLGFVKDMREGQVYLKDYDDYLDIYRAKGTGLQVVCISNFPDVDAVRPADFVETDFKGDDVRRNVVRANVAAARKQQALESKTCEDHVPLTAMPATCKDDPRIAVDHRDSVDPGECAPKLKKKALKPNGKKPSITLASTGVNMYWKTNRKRQDFPILQR